jgi:hypothetical protein
MGALTPQHLVADFFLNLHTKSDTSQPRPPAKSNSDDSSGTGVTLPPVVV